MSMYRAIWPITDESMSFIALIDQARRDLPQMTRMSHVRLTGSGRWSVAASRDVPGSGGITPWVLVYDAPAQEWRPADEPDSPTDLWVKPDRAEALADMDASGVGLYEAAARLGCTTRALERWCYRHGHGAIVSRMKARRNGSQDVREAS